MGEFASTLNDLVDAHNDRDEIFQMKLKLANLEDRSRRNNVKIRGIPEKVKPPDLKDYFIYIMKAVLPDVPQEDLIIDCIHRLPRPKHIASHLPRDTIVRIPFYHTKDNFMAATRRRDSLPSDLQDLSFFADLSAFTMQQRRQLATITKPLNNHHITYRWLYPAKLLVIRDGTTHLISNVKEGLHLMREWQIIASDTTDERNISSLVSTPNNYVAETG